MKKVFKILVIIIYIIIIIMPLHAQQDGKLAQVGMAFLDIPVGARAAAMGESMVSVSSGAEALFWNPAGLAFAERPELVINYNQWIADIKQLSSSIAYNLEGIGVIGVSFISMDYGEIKGTRFDNTEEGLGYIRIDDPNPSEIAVGIAFARRVSEKFAFGIQAKYVYQNLGESQTGYSSADLHTIESSIGEIAFDFGTVFYTGFKDLRVAMSIKNFSREIGYYDDKVPLPLTFTFGVAMNVLDLMDIGENHSLLMAIDALHPRDYPERINFGAEYSFNDMFFIRGGYKSVTDEQGLSAGLGIKYSISDYMTKFDYSYSDFGFFDTVQRVSFAVTF